MGVVRLGRILGFEEETHRAAVEITGYPATLLQDVPVALHVTADQLSDGIRCVVVFDDVLDVNAAVVLAVFGN